MHLSAVWQDNAVLQDNATAFEGLNRYIVWNKKNHSDKGMYILVYEWFSDIETTPTIIIFIFTICNFIVYIRTFQANK